MRRRKDPVVKTAQDIAQIGPYVSIVFDYQNRLTFLRAEWGLLLVQPPRQPPLRAAGADKF